MLFRSQNEQTLQFLVLLSEVSAVRVQDVVPAWGSVNRHHCHHRRRHRLHLRRLHWPGDRQTFSTGSEANACEGVDTRNKCNATYSTPMQQRNKTCPTRSGHQSAWGRQEGGENRMRTAPVHAPVVAVWQVLPLRTRRLCFRLRGVSHCEAEVCCRETALQTRNTSFKVNS